ncbi:hypothetical protein D3C81_2051500 [compost metagenome]
MIYCRKEWRTGYADRKRVDQKPQKELPAGQFAKIGTLCVRISVFVVLRRLLCVSVDQRRGDELSGSAPGRGFVYRTG